jgi:hypothetical protein
VTVEATARREFADEWERHQFLETLAPTDLDEELHRWEGDVWLRFPKADGTFHESLMPDAILSLSGKQLDGAVGVRLTYRIQAPGFDISAAQAGVEKVYLAADGFSSDLCQLVIYATTSGGVFDTATNLLTGSAPATITAGMVLTVTLLSDARTVTKQFKAVAPGGSTPGFIAIETPVVNNLATIANAFSGESDVVAVAGTFGGRSGVYLAWSALPVSGLPSELVAYLEVSNGYSAESYGDDYDAVVSPGVVLYDAQGVHLIADRITS